MKELGVVSPSFSWLKLQASEKVCLGMVVGIGEECKIVPQWVQDFLFWDYENGL